MEITVGVTLTKKIVVTDEMSAISMGSGDMAVFATPSMIALMENVAMECISSLLNEGDSTVGIYIASTHQKATAIGREVEATATVSAVEGRKISFTIEAKDESGVIGVAEHNRFIVTKERFMGNLK